MLSKYMPITLLTLCFGFNFTGCKRANSKLANSERSCSSKELSELKAKLAQLQSQSGASVTGSRVRQNFATDTRREGLANLYDHDDPGIRQILDMALSGRPGWEDQMSRACSVYAGKRAEARCEEVQRL
jgi:hypothetical protein